MQQPPNTHLAQLNVATALDDLDSERLSGFVNMLDAVNGVAERSPGFVWRLKDEDGNDATAVRVSDDPCFIVNLSVWETAEQMEHFVSNTVHAKMYARKGSWFKPHEKPHFVMWWVPAGHIPTVDEALARLDDLTQNGPSERAFGWDALPAVQMHKDKGCA